MVAEGNDRRVGGSVKAKMGMKLAEQQPGTTELRIVTDVNLLGRLGQFGQPLIKKKADQVLDEFAQNLRKKLSAQ
jgi:carbon monoxide dehydrogenase subunit G